MGMPVRGSSFIRFEDFNAKRNYLLFSKIPFISVSYPPFPRPSKFAPGIFAA
jgi:hypothetical protein